MKQVLFRERERRKLGLFELANGGTLFLDEIMEMPAQLQSKLLRALETRSFFRVGGVKKVDIDVRLIAATNRDKDKAIASGVFRADLFIGSIVLRSIFRPFVSVARTSSRLPITCLKRLRAQTLLSWPHR